MSASIVGWILPVVLAMVATGATWRGGGAAGHRYVALALLLWLAAVAVAELGGAQLPGLQTVEHPAFLTVVLGVCGVAGVGLWLHRSWGRTVTMGLGLGGAIGASALLLHHGLAAEQTSMAAALFAGSCLLVAHAAAPRLAAQDDARGDALGQGSLALWAHAAVVASIPAMLALCAYAWLQPGRLEMLAGPALWLSAVLAVLVALTLSGRAIAAVALALGGVGLLGLSAWGVSQASVAWELRLAITYAVLWSTTGLVAVVSGLQVARPLWRALLADPAQG